MSVTIWWCVSSSWCCSKSQKRTKKAKANYWLCWYHVLMLNFLCTACSPSDFYTKIYNVCHTNTFLWFFFGKATFYLNIKSWSFVEFISVVAANWKFNALKESWCQYFDQYSIASRLAMMLAAGWESESVQKETDFSTFADKTCCIWSHLPFWPVSVYNLSTGPGWTH